MDRLNRISRRNNRNRNKQPEVELKSHEQLDSELNN